MADQPAGASNPYFSTNPTGSGAVFFDKGPDLLSVHLGNLQNFEQAQRRQEAQKARTATDAVEMFKGLKLDTPGILDTDTAYFQNRVKGFHDFQTEALKAGFDATKPGAGAWYNQMKQQADQLNLDMKVSSGQKEAAAKALAEVLAKPDEYDIDATQKKVQDFGMLSYDQRNKNINWADLAVRKPDNLLELTKKNVLKDVPLDIDSRTKKDPVSGGFTVETTKNYTPTHIAGLAQAGYLGNDDVMKGVDRQYAKLVDPVKQQALEQQALAESAALGRTVSPKELWYREYIQGISPNEKTTSGISFSPMQHAYASNFYKTQDEQEYVKYIAEAIKKANTDDNTFWGPKLTPAPPIMGATGQAVQDVTGVKLPAANIQYSNALNNLPLGKAVIAQEKTNANGTYIDYQNIDNRVLNMKKEDGKVYLQTDESLLKSGGNGWEELNDRTIDKLVLGSKDPIKAAGVLRKTLEEMKAYPNQNVQFNAPKAKPAATPTITTKAEFDALPKGATFIRNGKTFTKQ
jgi:hypothetical protein